MTVGLLGASGLIGSAVAARLKPPHCRLYGRRGQGQEKLDLAAPGFPPDIFEGCDALVHAAGVTDEEFAADSAAAWQRATAGTSRLLQAARASGLRRLVYVSTAHVYGPLEGDITEARPANPLGDYGLAHFATEQLFRRAARLDGMDVLILRPCAVYGLPPDLAAFQRWSLIPFAFPRDLLTEGRIILKSDGEQRRNFVSTEAIAAEIMAFLAEPALPGRCRTQNVVGPDSLSVFAFAEYCRDLLAKLMGHPGQIERRPPSDGPSPPALCYRSNYTPADPRSTLADTIHGLAIKIRQTPALKV